MMKNRAFFHVPPYHGQSLVALMISVALSSSLFLVIMQFYSQHQQQNREMLLRLQLQMELQRVIQLMGKDLARSGFRAVNNKLKQNNIALFEQENTPSAVTIAQVNGEKNNSCVLFFYDLDANGCIGGNYKGDACVVNGRNNTREIERELFGYRLNQNMLETRLTYKSAVSLLLLLSAFLLLTNGAMCNEKVRWKFISVFKPSKLPKISINAVFSGCLVNHRCSKIKFVFR
nr:type II secretion system protein J [Aggregatibacter actinomycetemcomitans]